MTGISLGSNPITGVYVGSTLATGVYLGSTKIWPAASGVTFVGACTPASSTTSVSSLNLGLPAAAVAGDVVLANIISNANQTGDGTYSNSGPAGSTKFVADTPFEHATLHPGVGSAYAVRLAATDITNGYVTFGFQNFSQAAIRGVVFRGVSQTMFDVAAGVAASSAAVANPFTFSAPDITTDTDGCTLVAMGAVLPTVTTAITDPTGYTVGDVGNDINILQQFAYQQQASAGATGDVSMTFGPDSSISPQGWFAWLAALRPITPAITLSATFPASLHVGDTGSFVVTATRVDGATGSLTIEGSPLPDGMTVGATTDHGDDTFTATATYDLTTVQDVTATFSATGGSVAATALTHEFNVQAASVSGPTYRGANSAPGTITSIALPSGSQEGDTAWVAGDGNSANNFSLAGSSTVLAITAYESGKGLGVLKYTLTATDINNGSIPVHSSMNLTSVTVTSPATVDVQSPFATHTSAVPSPVALQASGVTATGNDLLLFVGAVRTQLQETGTFAQQSGFTSAVDTSVNGNDLTMAYKQVSPGATGNVGSTFTFAGAGTGTWGALLLALKSA